MPESSLPPVLTSLLDTPVPEPLKAVAGLAAVALEEARHLPQKLLGLPVAAAGQAMQASMRVQQRYAELVAKGDEVIGSLRRGDDTPSWATFDEDAPATAPTAVADPVVPVTVVDAAADADADAGAGLPADEDGPVVSLAPPASAAPGVGPGSAFDRQATADEGAPARRRRTSTATKATKAAPAKRARKATSPTTAAGQPAALPGTSRAARPAKATSGTGGSAAPVEGYDALTLPQLRARVKGYDRDTLEALLTYERAHGDRAPYVSMLVKRLDVVAGD